MNRTLKFRGKVDGQWWYSTPDDESWAQFWAIADRETVGQFTGALDKHRKEIYKGDILEAKEYWGEQDYAEVVWNEQQLQWYLTRNGEPREPLRSPFADGSMAFEIVGNVYENPEMVRSKS